MTLFFMHITKTAGGSIEELLRTAAKAGENIGFHNQGKPVTRDAFEGETLPKILFGHYVYGAHEMVGASPRYACFVREPIARTISHYHHLKNNDESHIGQQVRSYDDMEAYLKFARHWEFDNFMCRVISGVANETDYGDVGNNIYELARQNLRRQFEFIGIFEHLEESLRQMKKQLVPNLQMKLPVVNKGTYNRNIPPETMRMLRSLNRFDELLYEEACELFRERGKALAVTGRKFRHPRDWAVFRGFSRNSIKTRT